MNKATVTIPASQLDQFARLADLLSQASQVARRLSQGLAVSEDDQSWFWSKEWQRLENLADQDIKNKDVKGFDSMDELLADL